MVTATIRVAYMSAKLLPMHAEVLQESGSMWFYSEPYAVSRKRDWL